MASKINPHGISGSVKWSIDDDGLMLFEPVSGNEGLLDGDSLKFEMRLGKYEHLVKRIKARETVYLPEDSNGLFQGYANLVDVDFSNFNTSKVKNIDFMLCGCSSIKYVNFSNFDTSQATRMMGLFKGCLLLEKLDLSNFTASNVNNMYAMFADCYSLTDLDLSSFDTTNVTNMNCMFYGCHSLTDLDLSNFDMSNVITMDEMFEDCFHLERINLLKFDSCNRPSMNGIVTNCDCLNDFIIADSLEEKIKMLLDFYALFCYISPFMSFNRSIKMEYKLLDDVEKLTGLNFSDERQKIGGVRETDFTDLANWKLRRYCNNHMVKGQLFDIVKIVSFHNNLKRLVNTDSSEVNKMLKENGALSDINAYLSGVPIEDILA